MAILTSFPGLDVEIVVDGTALREYDPPADSDENIADDTSSIKYIEAQPGQEFGIRFTLGRQFRYLKNDLCFRASLDATMKRRWSSNKDDHARGTTFTVDSIKRSVGEQNVLRKFVFSTLTTEDRQVNGLDEAQVSNIGQIVLKLHRIEIRGRGSTRYKYAQNDDRVANSIAEKALKGRSISRKMELGATLPSGRAGYQLLKDYIDPKDRPFAVFTFRHRSMDDLYAEMIVPRPIPLEDREPESLSLEEMRELVRRQEADLQNLRRQIEENRAKLSGTQGIKHELKREHDPEFEESSGSAFRRRCIETVDLTDD